jgi:alkylhydroperoxidase family enzyme
LKSRCIRASKGSPHLIASPTDSSEEPEVQAPKLRALAEFVHRVVETQGAVSDAELARFVASGFGPRQALEVVVGIATYTLSIFANRMTQSESIR